MPYSKPSQIGYKKMDTAHEAAEKVAPRVKRYHSQIIQSLKANGPMTADETAEKIGASVLSIRPRFSELAEAGAIKDTGERHRNESGRSAAVWAVQ